jgi:DNA adenine methylase
MTQERSLKINETVPRTVLRYFGGKWRLAPWVISQLPEHRIYVEPFGGAAGVLLRKPRSAVEVYNDLDEEIVGIFSVIQDPVLCARLVRRLKRTPYSRAAFEQAFLPARDPVVRAQRAIVRSFQAFHHRALFEQKVQTFGDALHRNAGSRANEWRTYTRTLAFAHRRLQGVVIERRDALAVIRAQDTLQTLFYVDPPYVPAMRSSNKYRCELSLDQHRELLELLRSVKGRVVLSGYPSALYDEMLPDWGRLARPTTAHHSRTPRTEVLWLSPAAMAARPQEIP